MSLAIKLQQGGSSPTTYTMYGKTYNFDDFQRSADEGFNEYLSGLKRGVKDADQFREAYNNMMSGIKDGTITFENGHYHDSQGRYTNSKKKHKDYYGLVANYLYSKQGKSGESNSTWGGSTSIGKDLTRAIFNSDSGNISDFIDLDPLDTKTGKRGITNRAHFLADKLQEIANGFDTRYSGYTAQEKQDALNNINSAITALRDGKIDAGDYLALSRAASGLDYRLMFDDGSSATSVIQDSETPIIAPQQTPVAQNRQNNQPIEQQFQNYLSQHFPRKQLNKNIPLIDDTKFSSSNWTKNQLIRAVSQLDKEAIINMIYNALNNEDYLWSHDPRVKPYFANKAAAVTENTALKYLIHSGLTRGFFEKLSNGKYYIPGTYNHKLGYGLAVSPDEKSLSTIDLQDVPSLVNEVKSNYSKNFTSYHKQGGVLKAENGDSAPIAWDDNLYKYVQWGTDRYRNLYNNSSLSLQQRDIDASDKIAPQNNLYDPELGGEQTEKQSWWKGWVNQLTSNEALAKQWATDYLNRQSPYKTNYRSAWYTNGQFDFSKFKSSLFKAGQVSTDPAAKALWADAVNGIGHDVYRGKVYRIKGTNTYDTLENLQKQGYSLTSDTPQSFANNPLIDLYEVTKSPVAPTDPADNTDGTPSGNDSYVDPTQESTKPNTPGFWKTLGKAITTEAQNGDLVGAGRLLYSLRTNNRVANTIRKSLNPVLRDTYELYSPVTGAFSEMQFRNRQAANTNRLGSRVAANTSDASLGAAAILDANRQATDQQYQGFLADDKEILRTQQEALKRQEDNAARRSAVANFNRESINKTNREIADLEATRLKSNWQSTDNYLAGIEQRLRANYETNKARRQQFAMQTAQDDINNQYEDALLKSQQDFYKWSIDPANTGKSPYEYPGYDAYVNLKRKAARWRNAQLLGTHAKIYGYGYNNPLYGTTLSARHGGTLSLKSENLINKIIHESNS